MEYELIVKLKLEKNELLEKREILTQLIRTGFLSHLVDFNENTQRIIEVDSEIKKIAKTHKRKYIKKNGVMRNEPSKVRKAKYVKRGKIE